MSIVSELKKRAGPQVRFRGAPSDRSESDGEVIDLILIPPPPGRMGDMFKIARLLVRAGVPVRSAKKTIDALADGKTTFVRVPHVTNFPTLQKRLMAERVAVHRRKFKKVNVEQLRKKLGISQKDFADLFGLSVKTIQNWEQGRTIPEGPSARYLQLIENNPDEAIKAFAS